MCRTAALAAIVALLVACTSEAAPEPSAPRATAWIEDAQIVSNRWYASSGIDLDAPEVQLARAFLESRDTYVRTNDFAAAYIGFDRIYAGSRRAYPRIGTTHRHIMQAETVTNALGIEYSRISICEDLTQRAMPVGEGWANMETTAFVSLQVHRIRGVGTTDPRVDPTRRLPYPTWDVFAGWEIREILGPESLDDQCLNAVPRADPLAELRRPLSSPPPVLPFTPGWPEQIENDKNE